MILIIKKSNLFLIGAVLTVLVLCIKSAAGIFYSESAVFLHFDKKVVLDAGHGLPDGGATGPSGSVEMDINLAVTKALQAFLEQGGIEVVMTRTDENGLQSLNASSKKKSDIQNRLKIMKKSDADIFISIHMNKFSDSKYSGPQVFYARNDESKTLASLVQQEMISVLAPVSKREIKPTTSGIYLLDNAEIPAVLAECGFLSNVEEERLLINEDYQKKIAWSIYRGIIRYFEK